MSDYVRICNVSLNYPGQESGLLALDGVSLAIGRGEFIAVVGPSGCGKSTLLKLVAGLHPPTRGAVVVDGREVAGPLTIVGMAFQNPNLLPWRTTLENVLLPLEIVERYARRYRKERKFFVAKAYELLETVGLGKFAVRYPWELSGGMQQRASLCRALIHDPELLLLDEPFAALDAFTREELWGVLQDLWLKKRPTVVHVTHDLAEAVFLADVVHVVTKGPGRVSSSHIVDLPRPRTAFGAEFVAIVQMLRQRIAEVRAA